MSGAEPLGQVGATMLHVTVPAQLAVWHVFVVGSHTCSAPTQSESEPHAGLVGWLGSHDERDVSQ